MLFRLRAALLVVLLTAVVIPWCAVVLAHWVTPQPRRYQVAAMWTRFAMRAARALCGVTWQVKGWDNLPAGPAILLPKHQSTWETFWLPSFMPRRLSFVYKRELHLIPFFGWGMATLGMINIDRSRGQDAFHQVVRQGAEHLKDGWWIVVFPEGTRTAPGSLTRYKTGGARLAVETASLAAVGALLGAVGDGALVDTHGLRLACGALAVVAVLAVTAVLVLRRPRLMRVAQ